VWGVRARGCFLWSPEDLLNKNLSYASIITKSKLEIKFLLKTSETKKVLKIFCEVSLLLKNILLKA
jgi:hypothetical protein